MRDSPQGARTSTTLDVRYGQLRAHDRVLDFRAGTLTRTAEWVSPAHRGVRVTSVRFVSFTHRAVMGILYEVEPLDGRPNVVVQSELVANEELPSATNDPRVAAALEAPLVSEEHMVRDASALLIHRTRRSGLRMAACMDHEITGTPALRVISTSVPDLARVVATDVLEPGGSRSTRPGTSRPRGRTSTRCCCTSPTSTCIANR